VEQSQSAIKAAQRLYGVSLYSGTLEELPPEIRFGAAVMWDVIEHLRDPLHILKQINERLVVNGLLVVETGNYESASRLREGDQWGLFLYDHMYYFSPSSLQVLLERAGFHNFQLCRITTEPICTDSAAGVFPLSLIRKISRGIRNPALIADRVRDISARVTARKLWPEHWDIDVMVGAVRK
jgi:hypothetical protein